MLRDDSIIAGEGVLFQKVAQTYLRRWKGDKNTKGNYVNILNFHWMPNLALMPIHTITHDDIQDLILAREFTTAKTLNNCLIPLRGVFDTALKKQINFRKSATVGIENEKVGVRSAPPI